MVASLSVGSKMATLFILSVIPRQNIFAQTKPPSVAAQTKCATTSHFQASDLAKSVDISAYPNDLAGQIIHAYYDNPQKAPNISNMAGTVNLAILAAVKPFCLAQQAAAEKSTNVGKAKAVTSQTNTQVAAPSASAGSTSATTKVGIPQLLGLAVEDGAVTNSVNGTIMTLSSTPYGFLTAFGKDEDTQSKYAAFPILVRTGVSATFNVSSTTNPLASATRKDISQWQFKYTFRDTSPRSSDVVHLYQETLNGPANNVVASQSNPVFGPILYTLNQDVERVYKAAWTGSLKNLVGQAKIAMAGNNAAQLTQSKEAISSALLDALDKDEQYQAHLASVIDEIERIDGVPGNLGDVIQKYEAADQTYQNAQTTFAKQIADLPKGWNAAFSFSQQFPTSTTTASTSSGSSTATSNMPHTPDYLVSELDVTCEPKTLDADKEKQRVPCPLPKTSITSNFLGSFYTQPSVVLKESTFRGAQASVQLQWSLGPGFVAATKVANDSDKMTLSVSGNYQRLQENKDKSGKRPDILLGNVKLEIPISSGVSLPLSFSVANATTQIKETYVKGNFGLSFDLSKLSSLLKANQ